MRPLILELIDENLSWPSMLQRFVTRCYCFQKRYRCAAEFRDELIDLIEKWKKICFNDSIINYRVIFNEEIWPPTEVKPGSRMIIIIYARFNYYHFMIDFTKPLEKCVFNSSEPNNDSSINIFEIKYIFKFKI